jgi:hypothetical protein
LENLEADIGRDVSAFRGPFAGNFTYHLMCGYCRDT